jgi:group I intron endonuclease
MNSNSGIYIIKNTIDERVYVGSAVDLKKRKWSHLGQLKRKNHHCAHLQNFANKHGIDTLYFEVLEYVEDKDNLIEREQFYLSNIQNKFNSAPFAITMLS